MQLNSDTILSVDGIIFLNIFDTSTKRGLRDAIHRWKRKSSLNVSSTKMEKINFVKLASHKSETTYLKILQRDWCLPPLVTHAPMITRLPLLQLSTWKHHECSALKSAAHTSAQSKVKVNIAQITQYTRRRRDQAKSAQAHSSQSTKHKAHGVGIGSGCTFV